LEAIYGNAMTARVNVDTRICSGTHIDTGRCDCVRFVSKLFIALDPRWRSAEMLDESTLWRLYMEEQRSIRAIARLQGVSTRAVYDALIRHRIPRRPAGFRHTQMQLDHPVLDQAALRKLYLEEKRSIRTIAALTYVSTRKVYDLLRRYHIPRRSVGQQHTTPSSILVAHGSLDELMLRRMYEEEGQTIAAIAVAAQCSPSRIRNALVRWGIERRRRGRQYRARS
jgi:predicted DNA-binding protein YlxM (UPF0122 family)